MSRGKGIIVGVVVLAILVGLAFRQFKEDQKIGVAKQDEALPTLSIGEDIDKISIKHGKKDEIVLEKKGENWELTKPLTAAANQQSAKDVVSSLKDLKIERKVDLKIDDQVKKDKHLDPDQVMHVMAFKGADKKADLFFGSNQLMMLADKPDAVYAAKGYSSYTYEKEAKDWRDKDIMAKFDENAVANIAIENTRGSFSFTKGEKGWGGTFKGAAIEKFDDQIPSKVLTDVKNAKAEDFGDGKSAAETGLDSPEGKITVTLKDNAGKHALRVGKASGNGHFAQKEGDSTIFVIGKFATDWILADKAKFQKAADAGAPVAPTTAKKDMHADHPSH